MSSHSKFSPSGATRWLTCQASLGYSGGQVSDGASVYAAEGTAAHTLLERCWILGVDAIEFLGTEIDGFEVTQEMVDAIQLALDAISIRAKNRSVKTEVRIIHPTNPDFGGTIDVLITGPDYLGIVDLKYGAGQLVEVEGNDQLLCYATLALNTQFETIPEQVELVVVQPRAPHPDGPVRPWTVSTERLRNFAERLKQVFTNPSDKHVAGDHCKWCPAKANCIELYRITQEAATREFDSTLTETEIADLLEKEKAVKSYFEALRKEAHGRMDKGAEVPGFKLVNSWGNRRYNLTEEEILRKCRSKGFGKKQIFKQELLTPPNLEKLVGKELVSEITERPDNGTKLVPETDRRQAVIRKTAEQEFKFQDTGET